MTTRTPASTARVTWLEGEPTQEICSSIAALTAQAYARPEPRPGLPVPDGARETPASVRTRMIAGAGYLTITGADGRLVAAAATTRPGAHLFAARIVTARRGLLAGVLAALDEKARREGAPGVALDAVVERCLPSVYRRHGFRVEHWFRAPDKPLCEARMVRGRADARTSAPVPLPSGRILLWEDLGNGEVRARLPQDLPASALLAGADLRADPGARSDLQTLDSTADFLMPRRTDPSAVTLWRCAPGHAVPIHDLMPLILPTAHPLSQPGAKT